VFFCVLLDDMNHSVGLPGDNTRPHRKEILLFSCSSEEAFRDANETEKQTDLSGQQQAYLQKAVKHLQITLCKPLKLCRFKDKQNILCHWCKRPSFYSFGRAICKPLTSLYEKRILNRTLRFSQADIHYLLHVNKKKTSF
jgi:hypothetical protein